MNSFRSDATLRAAVGASKQKNPAGLIAAVRYLLQPTTPAKPLFARLIKPCLFHHRNGTSPSAIGFVVLSDKQRLSTNHIVLIVHVFDIPLRGSIGALYVGIALFLLSAVGIGLMTSSIAVPQQQTILGAFLLLVPAVVMSGFSTPLDNMPQVVQWLTYIDPLRYFPVVVRGVTLQGDSYILLINQYWPMAIIDLVSLTLAGWLFRYRMY